MPGFVDFAAIKEAVSFADTLSFLDLDLKRAGNQWRGPCPTCQTGGDRALVVTEGKGFFCFALKKGGDQIALAAHILDVPVKDAAQQLAEKAGIIQGTSTRNNTSSRSSPESERESGTQKLAPLSYLEADHEAVIAVGFDPEFAEAHGIGWANKGVARGHVLIPFRDEQGQLLGYVGVTDAWLPPDFKNNIVPFQKRA